MTRWGRGGGGERRACNVGSTVDDCNCSSSGGSPAAGSAVEAVSVVTSVPTVATVGGFVLAVMRIVVRLVCVDVSAKLSVKTFASVVPMGV